MTEMQQSSEKVTKAMTKTTKELPTDFDEKSVTAAMRSRLGYFREQADSLTLEGVRRVLEKDLGFDEFALDAHKRFIKQCLHECLESASNEDVSKSSGETREVTNSTIQEPVDLSEEHKPAKELGQLEDKEKSQGSPVQGAMDEAGTSPKNSEETDGVPSANALSEDTITKTIRKRAAYFRANSKTITLAGARRLLEEDLKLDKFALDSYRKLVKEELDKVLQSPADTGSANGVKNKKRKNNNSEESSKSLDSTDDAEEEEVRPKKRIASNKKTQSSEGLKNRKGAGKEIKNRKGLEKKTTKSSQKRPVESEDSEGAKAAGDLSEDARSQSSDEEPVKKKSEAPTQVYGKRVEHLKSVIRSCGMSVPPAVYKRAKQAPESKREASLIKELEEMLKKEGLSTNPSEKEIKAVKKQKEKTKELEGIDLSNIVSSSRRRSTSSFLPPPKPVVSVDEDEDEDNVDGNNDDDDDDDDNEDDSDNGSEEEVADESNSEEEINEDVEDDESD